jgi:phosphomannomutase
VTAVLYHAVETTVGKKVLAETIVVKEVLQEGGVNGGIVIQKDQVEEDKIISNFLLLFAITGFFVSLF